MGTRVSPVEIIVLGETLMGMLRILRMAINMISHEKSREMFQLLIAHTSSSVSMTN